MSGHFFNSRRSAHLHPSTTDHCVYASETELRNLQCWQKAAYICERPRGIYLVFIFFYIVLAVKSTTLTQIHCVCVLHQYSINDSIEILNLFISSQFSHYDVNSACFGG